MSKSNVCPDCGDQKMYDDGRAHSCFPRCPRCLLNHEKESYSNGICYACNADERRAWVAFAAGAIVRISGAINHHADVTAPPLLAIGAAVAAGVYADALLAEYRERFGKWVEA